MSNVKNFEEMFDDSTGVQNIESWDVSAGMFFRGMFSFLEGPTLVLDDWQTTINWQSDIDGIVYYTSAVQACWTTNSVKFPKLCGCEPEGCIETRDDAVNLVESANSAVDCNLFNAKTIAEKNSLIKRFHFETETDLSSLFYGCDIRGVTSLSSLNTFGVNNYDNMFNGAIIDTLLDVDDWLIHSGTSFSQMFLNAFFMITYEVTVSNNKFLLDNNANPTLAFQKGYIYRFVQTDSSNIGHPLRFYYDNDRNSLLSSYSSSIGLYVAYEGTTEGTTDPDGVSILTVPTGFQVSQIFFTTAQIMQTWATVLLLMMMWMQ